jgi:hypothetical protein
MRGLGPPEPEAGPDEFSFLLAEETEGAAVNDVTLFGASAAWPDAAAAAAALVADAGGAVARYN